LGCEIFRAAMRYTEYFIYDQLQNLVYYVYACDYARESFSGMIVKFNGESYEIIEKSDDKVLADNYFID
jgi:superfamily I DNA and RNA helicase